MALMRDCGGHDGSVWLAALHFKHLSSKLFKKGALFSLIGSVPFNCL